MITPIIYVVSCISSKTNEPIALKAFKQREDAIAYAKEQESQTNGNYYIRPIDLI